MQQENKVMPFVVGVGRSGTTLLRLMLDAHPDLAVPPETHFIPQLLQNEDISRDEFLKIITSAHTWHDFGVNEKELRLALYSLRSFSAAEGLRLFYQLYARKFQKRYYGDKTPLYLSSMLLIQCGLPEARFIHVIRDGRDVAMSYRGLWFGPGEDIRSAASFWKERISAGRNQASELKYYLEVRYEELITNTKSVLKEICTFIEIPFSEQMLHYYRQSNERLAELGDRFNEHGSVRVKRDDRMSIHAMTKYPPDKTRVQSWKCSMTEADQRLFESVAGKLLHDLGYETQFFQSGL
jgi:hypothetical protein